MDYQQVLDYLYGFINYETVPAPRGSGHFDLRRMDELMRRLGSPHRASRSVHITGTNGKGSVGAMVTSALTASGYTTGFYISPHLHDLRERIQINGVPIPESELVSLVEELRPVFDTVDGEAAYGRLTTFEVLTTLAFVYFMRRRVDFQVMEVGLGGRLDATNIITPEVGIITSVSLDHTEVLGNSPAQVAAEKAGIIKSGCVVVSAPQVAEVDEVISGTCRSVGVPLVRVGRDVTWRGIHADLDGQTLEVSGRLGGYRLTIPLLGEHQMENAATAVAALEALAERGFAITAEDIISGLARVDWPGRFQILHRRPFIVADGGHNPGAVKRLKTALEQYFGLSKAGSADNQRRCGKAILVFGASRDKDISSAVTELVPLFDGVIVTASRHPRAAAPEKLKDEFTRYGVTVQVAPDVGTALCDAVSLVGERGLVCVTGSLFTAAEAIEQVASQFTRW